MNIRPAKPEDFKAIWEIFHAVIQKGDSYSFVPETTKEEAKAYWMDPKTNPYVAELNGKIVGTYVLRQVQRGLGAHIGNGSYMVHPNFQGNRIGKAMGLHSLDEAKKLGFIAMQYTYVVSTNTPAVNLWKSIGFRIIGTVPKAYRHLTLGYVDTYVMYREL